MRRDTEFSQDAKVDSHPGVLLAVPTKHWDGGREARSLRLRLIMSNVTKTLAQILEAHDAPNAMPTTHEEALVRQSPLDPEPLDVMLDNPYDNMACTD
jgi:hypothetical protein